MLTRSSEYKLSTQGLPPKMVTLGTCVNRKFGDGRTFWVIPQILSHRQLHILYEHKSASVFSVTTETILKQPHYGKSGLLLNFFLSPFCKI